MKLKEKLEEAMRKSDSLIKSDKVMMDQVLGTDKNLPYILSNFLYSNEQFNFSLIEDLEKCFFEIELFSFEKRQLGIEKSLFGRWDFNSSMYHNFNYYLMGLDYRIEVSRKEEKIHNPNIEKDLKQLNLKDAIIVDLEFFEFPQWERQFDVSQKIKEIDFDKIKHDELRDYVKENLLHIEKEKIHLKIVKCKDQEDKNIYLPLYIGLGTNEPFGLGLKNKGDKSRWYKLSLDAAEPYLEEGKIKVISKESQVIYSTLTDNCQIIINDNSWNPKSNTVIATVVNTSCQNAKKSGNDLLNGYIEYSYSTKDKYLTLDKPISKVQPYYEKNNVTRIDIWKEYLKGKDLFEELKYLLSKSQKEYEKFFELFNCPYKIISELGTEKVVDLIGAKYNKILTEQEFSMLVDCVKWGNVNTISGDLYKLGIDSNRNRISSLLIQALLSTGRFKEHVDGDFAG
ncbi:TPA: hypothetical protein ACF35N_002701 [Vibrio parahaemolyticus]|uniref:hypothetical protein n=1 Tax=Vibrio parahaemolyticus TaxID=670 RepID=UPI0003F4FE5C|nr:hypothetical protein [Vibrio parahaemolyticus]EJI1281158.1 hypothetical protein [Vibrio vulnificus]TNZ82966.1 hypothetical protein CGK38_24050 [Vibrio parahaemolyticus]